ncbi:MAG: oxidoreductase [Nitrospina sp.]|jgi:glucose/arabinose dehydrogenase|nr:oxidoreductase [Nitrospina sp.]MBT5632917.1 oxidoreductase [Nitrospina sp.]
MRKTGFAIIFLSLILFSQAYSSHALERNAQKLDSLNLPHDVSIHLFAREVPRARHMAFDDQGALFLSQAKEGKVVALPDSDKNGEADKKVLIIENRDIPHGLAFIQLEEGYYLYIAEETQVIRLKRLAKPFKYGKPETIIANIPDGGHFTRTLKIKNNKLYLSVGSSCNVCIEKDPLRAAISRFNLDGSGREIFAQGLRNSVGIEFSPYTGELWGVNNGRDRLGDDHPREELNIIKQGKHYGWPYCYESKFFDEDFGRSFDCTKTEIPAYTFTAHMAPLGLAFYQKGTLPKQYNHSVFIAFHGSWNRSVPAGYKVVRLKLDAKGNILSHEDFISGWLRKSGAPDGRPVDIEQSPEGDLYLSDDYLGVVYRITKKKHTSNESAVNN